MRRLSIAAFSVYLLTLATAWAQTAAPIDALYRALGLDDVLEVMREEGLSYGQEMQAELLAGQGGARWNETVSQIYDVALMREAVRGRLDIELAAEDLAPIINFFASDLGQRIVTLEVSARQAFLDEDIEAFSREAFAALEQEGGARSEMIKELVEGAELVENNVAGALNSNFAFFSGLSSGGGMPGQMSEEELLADVWSQEEAIRADTTEWLYAYLNLAYQPLTDDELRAYIDFYTSAPGQTLNQAVFLAFNDMFGAVSFALGQSAAMFMGGEEL